ncbi:MAG: response regulator [Deltaproteobacteria bacterium]|nr:response regulator [Deltaproteobacteria bacterium]
MTLSESSAKILLIEDDPSSATRLIQLLSEDGFEVEWRDNATDAAVRIGQGHRPDAIVLDYRLPHRDGLQLAHDARARWPTIPLVFVTSYSEVLQRIEPMSPPAIVVSKPVVYSDLVRILQRLVGASQIQD